MNKHVATFIQVFRNSVVDTQMPIADDEDVSYTKAAWAWSVLILGNVFFLNIVMLNFLISVIGSSYEEVMNKSIIYAYKDKTRLNVDASILSSGFYNKIR